jgi:hypothetical protein
MRTVKHVLLASLTLCVVGSLVAYEAADTEKPKYDIETIMGKAHKAPEGEASLLKKVATGKANANQKKELLGLYEELAKNKPEKGGQDDWKTRTTAMVKAAKEVVDNKPGAAGKLGKTVNCKGCHALHK